MFSHSAGECSRRWSAVPVVVDIVDLFVLFVAYCVVCCVCVVEEKML